MKRLAFTQKIYDYDTIREAINDMIVMHKKGWTPIEQAECVEYCGEKSIFVYENGNNYSVEYYK